MYVNICPQSSVTTKPFFFLLVDESNKQQVLVYFRTGCIQKQDRILKNPQEAVCGVPMCVCVCVGTFLLKIAQM